ncbi:LysM domain-containingprotein [Purpureocillium lavendulum]|uniref:LysM domain-containingprotein n=1 Tax=Purpureocillium lavendulum TaxID=1247861 RepID=A0AB34G1T3_9HYPO|nr:LysM domain-containingprotein [Purpureocillium lavendulum]
MADPGMPTDASSRQTSSAQTAFPSSVRPRTRRLVSTADDRGSRASSPRASVNEGNSLLSAYSASASRSASPRPPAGADGGTLGQFLGDSWTQSWNSVQGLASSLTGSGSAFKAPATPFSRRDTSRASSRKGGSGRSSSAWGPAPPPQNAGHGDIGAGSLAEREAALRAARTASVLQSHDNVNGGLDIAGNHKRRNSDDVVSADRSQTEDCLVYIHRVGTNDTYAGIILRFKCREDVFRRANGLWSRDSIQTRKWLAIPVDACEVRGRPCDAPSSQNSREVDLLALTPAAVDAQPAGVQDDFFTSKPQRDELTQSEPRPQDEDGPWTHVRWVQIESIREPVQIGRMPRQSLGYFPPRRKKSVGTISTLSTPRQSSDISSLPPGSMERVPSRRQSSLSSVHQLSGTPLPTRSRVGSDARDNRPAWMRGPGGVGSMGRNTRTPGPDKDYFNSWARKHLPALNVDGLPSMSVMGSETARFGFASESTAIVESSFEQGRDTGSTSRQGSGLDRAAAAVETWLRGALAKRPNTPLVGGRTGWPAGLSADLNGSDLIELADTGSDDGRIAPRDNSAALMAATSTSGRSDGEGGLVRGGRVATSWTAQDRHKSD